MAVAAPAPPRIRDSRLTSVWDKVHGGERLSRADGLALFETEDLHAVGRMADVAKSRRHGDQVFFVTEYVDGTTVTKLVELSG